MLRPGLRSVYPSRDGSADPRPEGEIRENSCARDADGRALLPISSGRLAAGTYVYQVFGGEPSSSNV